MDLDGARKDQQAIKAKVKTLETEKEAINTVIASLEEELHVVIEKRDKVYEKIRELRNKREEGVFLYFYIHILCLKHSFLITYHVTCLSRILAFTRTARS